MSDTWAEGELSRKTAPWSEKKQPPQLEDQKLKTKSEISTLAWPWPSNLPPWGRWAQQLACLVQPRLEPQQDASLTLNAQLQVWEAQQRELLEERVQHEQQQPEEEEEGQQPLASPRPLSMRPWHLPAQNPRAQDRLPCLFGTHFHRQDAF